MEDNVFLTRGNVGKNASPSPFFTRKRDCSYERTFSHGVLNRPRHAKRSFGHMRTAKAQISLHIRVVWSGTSLLQNV